MTFRAGLTLPNRDRVGRSPGQPGGIGLFEAAFSDSTRTPKLTKETFAGYGTYRTSDLERLWAEGRRLDLVVVGALKLPHDLPAQLADDVFERVTVLGLFSAPPLVADRLREHKLTHHPWGGLLAVPLAVAEAKAVLRLATRVRRRIARRRAQPRSAA